MNTVMNHNSKIAIPYYGKLSRPSLGLERVYFILEKGEAGSNPEQVSIGVWDSREDATLPQWLEQNGVRDLICLERPGQVIAGQLFEYGIHVDGELGEEARFHLEAMQIF